METKLSQISTKDTKPPIVTFKKRRGAKPFRTRYDSLPSSNNNVGPDNIFSSFDDELHQDIKRRKTASIVTASSKTSPTSREATLPASQSMANQTSYVRKNPNAPTRNFGPVKAPSNVRTTTILDLQPDTCKDYKTIGYCGFGDSCKFLHAREDYKQGWQLDKEWERVTKGKNIKGTIVASANNKNERREDVDQDDAERENIPLACLICGDPYKNPIITKCGHYFCEPCALKRCKKDPNCAVCGAGTGGVFNSARTPVKQAKHTMVASHALDCVRLSRTWSVDPTALATEIVYYDKLSRLAIAQRSINGKF
ncbi:hypothetical protein B7463_g7129, partial [Scytalidium lignicola]